jgi:hypothetical protein
VLQQNHDIGLIDEHSLIVAKIPVDGQNTFHSKFPRKSSLSEILRTVYFRHSALGDLSIKQIFSETMWKLLDDMS